MQVFSVSVLDFHIVFFAFKSSSSTAPIESWPSAENRFKINVSRFLSILATFFIGLKAGAHGPGAPLVKEPPGPRPNRFEDLYTP